MALYPAQAGGREPAPKLNTISIRRTMSRASDYVDKYAEAAMEQMRKYGIPASVTLAQGILESASGQSELSRKGNNHFFGGVSFFRTRGIRTEPGLAQTLSQGSYGEHFQSEAQECQNANGSF